MGQSLSNVLVHFVFSTKNRSPTLDNAWRAELHGYIAGIVKNKGTKLIIANSVQDHIHLLLPLPRDVSISEIMKTVKMGSSGWIREKTPTGPPFQWQGGYGAFSVSPAHKDSVIEYIKSQEEHHREVNFKDEFLRLLTIYDVSYDDAYVWD